jgi:hypothetical protein
MVTAYYQTRQRAALPVQHVMMKRSSVLYFLGQMDDGRDSDRFGSDEKKTGR